MHVVDAVEREGQRLADVPDHDLQLGKAVEGARHQDAQGVHAHLDREAVDGPVQAALQQRLDQPLGGTLRVDIDRHVHGLGGLEDRPELLVVEIFAVGVGVDDNPLQAELGHRPLDLLGGGGRVLGRAGGQGGEAGGVGGDLLGDPVVGEGGEADRLVAVHHLHARSGQRQDLHVDAALVHVAQALLAHVGHALADEGGPGAGALQVEAPQAVEARIVKPALVEDAAVDLEHFRRAEGLLGGDALVGRLAGLGVFDDADRLQGGHAGFLT